MELQHIGVKIYASQASREKIDNAIPIFHRWIKDNFIDDELMIDVADYAHVPMGPGIMLIGHHSYFAIEPGAEDRFGLLYVARTKRDGSNVDRITDAIRRALRASAQLEQEAEFSGTLKLDHRDLRIFANDRHFGKNDPATFEAVKGDISKAVSAVYGVDAELKYEQGDARSLFAVEVHLPSTFSPSAISSAGV